MHRNFLDKGEKMTSQHFKLFYWLSQVKRSKGGCQKLFCGTRPSRGFQIRGDPTFISFTDVQKYRFYRFRVYRRGGTPLPTNVLKKTSNLSKRLYMPKKNTLKGFVEENHCKQLYYDPLKRQNLMVLQEMY